MTEDTNRVRAKHRPGDMIDDTDRKILAFLSEDSSQPYAELGKKVHLSPPAVHERVKKLKAAGVITGSTINLDGAKIGRPFLAFVHVSLTGVGVRERYIQLQDHKGVEEIHSVAGDSCLLVKVRCESAAGLEELFVQLRDFGDVTSTRSHVVLSTFLERGPQPLLD